MTYFSGRDGAAYMKIGSAWEKIGKATNFQLTSSQASLDTTTLEDYDKTVIYGVRAAAGSCRILYYQSTSGNQAENYASKLFSKLVKPSGSSPFESENVQMRFAINDGSGSSGGVKGRYIEVDTVLTSASMNVGVGEIFAIDVSFDVNGAPSASSI